MTDGEQAVGTKDKLTLIFIRIAFEMTTRFNTWSTHAVVGNDVTAYRGSGVFPHANLVQIT